MNDSQRSQLDLHAIQAHITLAESSLEGEVDTNNDYILGYTGADLAVFNFFIPLTLTGLTDDTLADTAAFFRTRDAPYAVSLEEHRVQDGTEYLSRRRYQPLPPQPIMALEKIPADPVAMPPNLHLEAVNTVPAMAAFYTLLEAVFGYTTEEVTLLYPTTQLNQDRIRHAVGFVDGRPVVAGSAIQSHEVVSIWNLCTLDDARRQGYATALLKHLLADAVRDGAKMSLIYATPMSFSLLNHLGYKLYAMRQWFLPQELD